MLKKEDFDEALNRKLELSLKEDDLIYLQDVDSFEIVKIINFVDTVLVDLNKDVNLDQLFTDEKISLKKIREIIYEGQ
jgi:hypothetical protein